MSTKHAQNVKFYFEKPEAHCYVPCHTLKKLPKPETYCYASRIIFQPTVRYWHPKEPNNQVYPKTDRKPVSYTHLTLPTICSV
eukprot:804181-Alexandrium_andersonii.AAC.1